jgi:hypothetical protein
MSSEMGRANRSGAAAHPDQKVTLTLEATQTCTSYEYELRQRPRDPHRFLLLPVVGDERNGGRIYAYYACLIDRMCSRSSLNLTRT